MRRDSNWIVRLLSRVPKVAQPYVRRSIANVRWLGVTLIGPLWKWSHKWSWGYGWRTEWRGNTTRVPVPDDSLFPEDANFQAIGRALLAGRVRRERPRD